MFNYASVSLALILALQVRGHAIITPALGGGTTRDDVQRPTRAAPCGKNVNIAALMATSEAVPVTGGNIAATITNFNLGLDGSRFVTAQIDPTGTGENFQDATVTTNGDKFSTTIGTSQPLAVQVPAGMTASGGASGNMMLVSFKNVFGFGNCIAVTMGAATGSTANTTTTDVTDTTTTASGTGTTGTGTTTLATTGENLKAGVGSGAARAGAVAKAAKAGRAGAA